MSEELLLDVYKINDLCAIDLFDVFKDNYALFKLKVVLENEDAPCFIEKYNVIGWDCDKDYFKLYETSSLNKVIKQFKIRDIKKIIRVK